MNIFFREMRANFKSLVIWSVIVILFNVIGFSKFSAYYQNPEMLAILDGFPPAVLSAFSINSFNLTTVTGFYGIMIAYFGLILSIASVMWGSDIISKEERGKTVEFSLTLPVTRSRFITAKTAAAAVNCIVLLLITWGMTLVGAQQYKPDAIFYKYVSISIPAYFLMQMIFLAVGVLFGCAVKKHKQAGSAAISILLATYFASVMAGLDKNLDFLKYLSPFKYFDPILMLRDFRLEIPFVVLSLGIIAVCLSIAYASYQKRDLYI
ncbi:MAG: ABC transporter permease subunit [Chloroflexi bacterium]|nr:ABC transporter permease subunit [Chloroflexota bacterium]